MLIWVLNLPLKVISYAYQTKLISFCDLYFGESKGNSSGKKLIMFKTKH